MAHQLEINDERDIVVARVLAREMAADIGFSTMDQSRIATAVSELTRNVLRYATNGRGLVTFRTIDEAKQGIEIKVCDQGPGIADVEVAMREGYSSGRGLGLGPSGHQTTYGLNATGDRTGVWNHGDGAEMAALTTQEREDQHGA